MAKKITVQDVDIRLFIDGQSEYICLTDIAGKFGESAYLIRNWLKNTGTLKFLATWESLKNSNFDYEAYKDILDNATSNSFAMSAIKWIKGTNAIGIISKRGRYGGGSFAHSDIALNFCYWLSPEFQVYFIQEFQRLKTEEAKLLNTQWSVRRIIARTNFHIHSEAVRENLVPIIDWNTKREAIYQASEADLLNLAVFGMTAKEWKSINPKLRGNMRDHATTEQLHILANLESINAEFLALKLSREDRLKRLNEIARRHSDIIMRNRIQEQKLKAISKQKGAKGK